jgi:hypothetical protein
MAMAELMEERKKFAELNDEFLSGGY